MREAICENCRWWDTWANLASDTGLCRRSHPFPDGHAGQAVWPFTKLSDWCGEFAERAAEVSRSDLDTVETKGWQYFYDVPEAGALLGLTRNASYVAAKRGDFGEVVVIGKLIRVNKLAFHKKFDLPVEGLL